MPEELELPIKGADACPHCGSKERIIENLIAKLKAEGKLPQQSFPKGISEQVVLFDPTRTTILAAQMKIPIVFTYWDICQECKDFYCTGVEIFEGAAEFKAGPQAHGPGGPLNPPGGRRAP